MPEVAIRAESATHQPDDAKIDAEFDRFERVAKPMPGGGWYDPIHGAPEMPAGVPAADWQRLLDDCGGLGRSKALGCHSAPRERRSPATAGK